MSLIGKTRGRPITKIQFEQIVKRFLVFLKRELNIHQDIPIIYIDDPGFSKNVCAFGEFSENENIIFLSIINRHPIDILRTLAHEYVHYKQRIQNRLINKSSNAGSAIENEANAKAGEIIRKYGQLNPNLFEFMSIR
jgi:Zn-dependent peptidase ImmA (M78 family)